MATMIDAIPDFYGESRVWKYLKKNLSDDVIVYNGREVKGKEFDFCLLVPGKGIVIIEVKGWKPSQVTVLGQNRILLSGMDEEQKSPKTQARSYRFNLIEKLGAELQVRPFVTDLVCFPLMTEEDFIETGLSHILEREGVLLKNDLEDGTKLTSRINQVLDQPAMGAMLLDREMLNKIRSYFEPGYAAQKEELHFSSSDAPYSILQVLPAHFQQEDAEKLVEQYAAGSKLILFFKEEAGLRLFKQVLAGWLAKSSLKLEGPRVFFESREQNPLWLQSSSNLRLFNIDAFLLPARTRQNLPEIRIENGKYSSDELAVLEQLAEYVSFNLVQYQIEHQPANANIMIQAGAGTGKTYSMVSRVAFLAMGKDPFLKKLETDLGMITFTNEAADTMRNRLTELFMNYYRITRKPVYLKKIRELMNARITTIHRFCLNLLRMNSLEAGLGTQFSISSDQNLRNQIYKKHLDTYLQNLPEGKKQDLWNNQVPNYSLIKILKELADRIFNKNIPLDQISKKTLGTGIRETIPDFPDLILQVLLPAEQEYDQTLREQNRIELNRIISSMAELLKTENRLEALDLKVLFIDEFQDTDNSQIELIEKIDEVCTHPLPLFVVGDLKQSIYRFRGATMSAFEKLKENVREWNNFSLQLNYRSDTGLLNSMDQTFLQMALTGRLPYESQDRLMGVKDLNIEDPIVFVPYKDNAFEERMQTLMKTVREQAEEIRREMHKRSLSKEERTIAILVRTNSEAANVLEAGQKAGIPIDNDQNGRLFQSQAAGDALKLVRTLTTFTDPTVLADFLSSNFFGKPVKMASISGMPAEERQKILEDVLNESLQLRMNQTWAEVKHSAYSEPILGVMHRFFNQLQPWKHFSANPHVQNQYRFEYDQIIEDLQNHWRTDSVSVSDVQTYLETSILTGRAINLRELSREEEEKEVPILCMTIHKSKGLEFGTVILPFLDRNLEKEKMNQIEVDLNEKGFGYSIKQMEYQNLILQRNTPFQSDAEGQEQISEEVRILYVAMTRAIRKLIWLSYTDKSSSLSLSEYLKEPVYD